MLYVGYQFDKMQSCIIESTENASTLFTNTFCFEIDLSTSSL